MEEQKKPPSAAKLAAIQKAREQERNTVSTMEERTGLLEKLYAMLKAEQKPIPEADLARRFYGADTDTNRTKVKRHLKALHAGSNLAYPSHALGLQRLPINGSKSYNWTADIHVLKGKLNKLGAKPEAAANAMTRDRALALALARKYLRDMMPPHLMEQLETDFNAAEALVQEVTRRDGIEENLNLLRQRVDMAQRGQHLHKADVDTDTLDKIYSAITQSRRVSFTYQSSSGSKRHEKMSVAGVLLRTPKIYLYALPDKKENKPENLLAFQVNLVSELEIHTRTPSAVSAFDMKSFVQDGFTDILVDYRDRTLHKVQIEVADVGNLIRDLQEFPLHRQQKLKKLKKDKYLLEFPSRRTHQLVEYIVGRGSVFTVVAPAVLVADIKRALENSLAVYT